MKAMITRLVGINRKSVGLTLTTDLWNDIIESANTNPDKKITVTSSRSGECNISVEQ